MSFGALRQRLRALLLPTELPQLPLSAGRDALFVRLVGLLYVLVFASLWPQLLGLFGTQGLYPTHLVLGSVAADLGPRKYLLLPTALWLSPTDTALHLCCAAGILAGLSVLLLRLVWPSLLLAWLCHLSLLSVGGAFLSFQWDALQSELGLLLLLAVPVRYRRPEPLVLIQLGRWLLVWLLVRVLFGAGFVKLASGDPTWRSLTALHHHFETQPLPTLLGYYAHALPSIIKRSLVVYALLCETVLPPLFLLPRLRPYLLGPTVLLQLGILLTGNYGYFNLQVLVLCLLLSPPHWLSRLVPVPTARAAEDEDDPSQHRLPPHLLTALPRLAAALILFAASIGHLLLTLRIDPQLPSPIRRAMQVTAPIHAVSHYGPFAAMTTTRPELILEGSQDGLTWREYSFRYKPGDLQRAPRWNAPHQPRLDWQMWFAALGSPKDSPWLEVLLLRLLEGSPDVLWLFDHDPFAGQRPRYLRITHYQYRFTTLAERKQTGAYFVRHTPLPYVSPVGMTALDP